MMPAMPRLLHFIWVGSTMPDHLMSNVHWWKMLHPSWTVRIWTDRDFGWLANQRLFDEAESIVPRDAVGQFRSDVARYEILLQHGGFYADVDTHPMRPIDDSVLKHDAFAVKEDRTWIGNTYLGSAPGHPVFAEIIQGMQANVKRFRGRRANILSGPKYITNIWRRHGAYEAPTTWGFPYSYADVKRGTVPATIPDTAYAVHEWHHTRRLMEARTRGR
jgi:mannosyltransferase OCH1-like enzyme